MCEQLVLIWGNRKWPNLKDKFVYFKDGMKDVIKTLELISAQSSYLSDVYFIIEMEKYWAKDFKIDFFFYFFFIRNI